MYTSVPLNGKLYLLQYKILMTASPGARCGQPDEQIAELG
jgi:hypothetical protein